ncbi:MAG TPA: RIP metalloprotease RseP [Leeuwenhoekiella sp.]|nr:RIP metalloprotease RseP [Leeuwenhoekiella sp.]
MDPFFVKAIQFILSLSLLIILHEFGHFIPARIFKIKVEKFFLFFDIKFALFKKKIGDTVYGIGWLPLGGYCKMAGMIDESMDTEAMGEEPKPWEFRSKPAWQRLIVMLGGVTVNVFVALVIYSCIIGFYGEPFTSKEDLKNGFAVSPLMEKYGFQQGDKIVDVNGEPFKDQLMIRQYLMVRDVQNIRVEHENGDIENLQLPDDIGMQLFKSGEMPGLTFDRIPVKIDSMAADGAAEKAGIKITDKIKSVNGHPFNYRSDVSYALQKKRANEATVIVERDGRSLEKKLNIGDDQKLGIYFRPINEDYGIERQNEKYSLGTSISKGISYGYWKLHDYVAQFKYIFTAKGATQVGGFGAIAGLFPDTWNWLTFWETTAFISIALAFMNILPIPALDGGHVTFLLYEMITGRTPSDKFLEYAQIIGFFLILALVLFANGNDVYRWITGN